MAYIKPTLTTFGNLSDIVHAAGAGGFIDNAAGDNYDDVSYNPSEL